jgi:hypothetical protein
MNYSFKLMLCAAVLATGWYGCEFCVHVATQTDRDVDARVRRWPQQSEMQAEIVGSSITARDAIPDEKLEQLLKRSIGKATFESPTKDDITRFETLLLETLHEPEHRSELATQWANAGWELVHWTVNDQSLLAICEQEHELRGRGLYVIRVNSESNLVLQAPHRFYDMGSGTIVSKLFQENDCRAAAWNTVHRKQVDLAHCPDSFLNAFTRAMLNYNAQSIVVQIHGFENDNQKGRARSAKMIVSNATEYPGRTAREATIRFKEDFGGDNVRLYPLEVRQLGGTKNEQASAVYEMGSVGFLHLELNKKFREQLQNSEALRTAFFDSLAVSASISSDSDNR